jgi:hypothetical protein
MVVTLGRHRFHRQRMDKRKRKAGRQPWNKLKEREAERGKVEKKFQKKRFKIGCYVCMNVETEIRQSLVM